MNWIRMVLDGFMMAAYFNLLAAAVAIIQSPADVSLLSAIHYQGCAGTSHESGEPVLYALDLFFLDVWLIQKKCKKRFIIPGTEGHPGYAFRAWMQSYALPEHLLQWPLLLCPVMALLQAGLGVLLVRLSS